MNLVSVVFTVRYLNIEQDYVKILTLGTQDEMVIDFYPETSYYIDDVPNKIYF